MSRFDALPVSPFTRLNKLLEGVLIAGAYCAMATFVILMIVKYTIGLRVTKEEEIEGLDLTQHGERLH